MMENKTVYTQLNEIATSKSKEFNFYGIIVDVDYKISYDMRGKTQDEYRLKINDGSMNESLNVTAYSEINKFPNNLLQRGQIVRFHRLYKNFFKNSVNFYLCGRIGPISSAVVFNLPPPNSLFSYVPRFQSHVHFVRSETDEEILNGLISNADKILKKSVSSPVLPNVSQPQQNNQSPAASAKKVSSVFKDISELIYGNANYYNTLLQVVSCYSNKRNGTVILRVWDGTRNLQKTFATWNQDLQLIYGDEEREKLIADQNKLYDVICYGEHGRDAANLNAGDYIALVNVHFFVPGKCYYPSLVMHTGPGTIKRASDITGDTRRIVKLTKKNAEEYFDCIDQMIKEHEASFTSPKEDIIDQSETNSLLSNIKEEVEDTSDESNRDIPLNEIMNLAIVGVQTTQSSTTSENSDGSTQNSINSSQYCPNKVHGTTVADLSTQNMPKEIPSQNVQINVNSTVSKIQSTSAIRRTASMAFPESSQNSDDSHPAKRQCDDKLIGIIPQSQESSSSTQALFDKLESKKRQACADDIDEDEFLYPQNEEEKMLHAITDTQMEKMWEFAESGGNSKHSAAEQ